MIKKPFFSLTSPAMEYASAKNLLSGPREASPPNQITLLFDKDKVAEPDSDKDVKITVAVGDTFETGQKIAPFEGADDYLVSSITGRVASIGVLQGDFGREYTAITLRASGDEKRNGEFAEKCQEPSMEHAAEFLRALPGNPPKVLFDGGLDGIKRIVILGVDRDLLCVTNQYVVRTETESLKKGIELLKKLTGINDVSLLVHGYLENVAKSVCESVVIADSAYPATHPSMLVKQLTGVELAPGMRPEDAGICFVSAEAAAAVEKAYASKTPAIPKLVTFVNKDCSMLMAKVPVGTRVKAVCEAFDTLVTETDRLIVGGPMTGSSVWREDFPVLNDTDAVLVQDGECISRVSDEPCINCGECVRVCPSRIAVNMLVRLLEAGQYETAAEEYDLHSCMECGLCSYACVAKMPVFQYIRLAKHELAQMKETEAEDDES